MQTTSVKNPTWWGEDHNSAWERSKEAMKRDWEQTKHDFSKKAGADLRQNVGDTVKQASGSEVIPAHGTPNMKADDDFSTVEPAYRYGVGVSAQFRKQGEWNRDFETKLEKEWFEVGMPLPWNDAKPYVRRGFEQSRKS